MKFLVAALVVIATVFGLSACGSAPAPSPNKAYLKQVRSDFPVLKNASNANLLGMGHAVCRSLNNGASIYDIFNTLDSVGMPPKISGEVAGAAVRHFCPRFSYIAK